MKKQYRGHPKYIYLAGIIDGEGCLTMYKEDTGSYGRGFQYHPLLRVSNTYRGLLEKLKKDFKMGFITWTTNRNGNRKDVGNWSLNSNGLRELIPLIKPYIFVKKKQLLCLEKALSLISSKQTAIQHKESYNKLDKIYLELRKLNKIGKS